MDQNIQQLHKAWALTKSLKDTSSKPINFDDLTSSIISTGPFYYYIIDFYDMKLSNISSSVFDVHGLHPESLTINEVLETIHPDDIEFVVKAEALITKIFEELGMEKLVNYKMNYSFRSKIKSGEYVMLNHQAIMLTMDENGGYGKSLNIHTRIDHISAANTYKISLIGLNGEPSFMNLSIDDKEEYKIEFSKREIDIIKLIGEGLNNHDIGEKLFISPLTVKKHRKNILEKSKSKNTMQLIRKCLIQGII